MRAGHGGRLNKSRGQAALFICTHLLDELEAEVEAYAVEIRKDVVPVDLRREEQERILVVGVELIPPGLHQRNQVECLNEKDGTLF